jgi:hypothetical protein
VGLAGIGLLVAGMVARCLARRSALGSPDRLHGVVYATLWVAVCYLLFTFVIANKEGRFILIWAPGLALLGSIGLSLLMGTRAMGRVAAIVVVAVLLTQSALCASGLRHDPWARRSPHVTGTSSAARRLAASRPGTVVFYTGKFNGSFIFNVRRFDPGRRVVVLRGSKLLFSMPAMQSHGLHLHATTREEILKVLRDCGVRFLLVEEPTPVLDRVGPVMDELRALVRSELFARRAVYALAASEPPLGRRLCLYEFLEAGPAQADVLTIDLPASGRVIRVPFRRLGVPTALPKQDETRSG